MSEKDLIASITNKFNYSLRIYNYPDKNLFTIDIDVPGIQHLSLQFTEEQMSAFAKELKENI